MEFYRYGQIVEVRIDDGNGNWKVRPVVILSSDEDCDANDAEVLVLLISTKPRAVIPHYHIKVHDGDYWDRYTGLTRPCWAKCDWVRTIQLSQIDRILGYMPDDLLELIVDKYDQLRRMGFTGWQ